MVTIDYICVLLSIKNLSNIEVSIIINFISLVHSNIEHLAIKISMYICVPTYCNHL